MTKFNKILDKCKEEFTKIPGVVGVGEGIDDENNKCIVVVMQELDESQELPNSIEGISIIKKEIGTINSQ